MYRPFHRPFIIQYTSGNIFSHRQTNDSSVTASHVLIDTIGVERHAIHDDGRGVASDYH